MGYRKYREDPGAEGSERETQGSPRKDSNIQEKKESVAYSQELRRRVSKLIRGGD